MSKLKTAAFICLNDANDMPPINHAFLINNFDVIIQVIDADSDWYNDLPNPGVAYRFALDHNLDLSRSVVIGKNSGIKDLILVGELQGKEGLRFVGSRDSSYIKSGTLVPDSVVGFTIIGEQGLKWLPLRIDESNKDLMFAKNTGMGYMDFEKFTKGSWIDRTDLMFYTKIN